VGDWGGGSGRKVPQTMYTHVSKCENDEIKGKGKKRSMKSISSWGNDCIQDCDGCVPFSQKKKKSVFTFICLLETHTYLVIEGTCQGFIFGKKRLSPHLPSLSSFLLPPSVCKGHGY
jgi:hypothetical protein